MEVGTVTFVERPDNNMQHRFGRVRNDGWLAAAVGNDVLLRARTVIDYRRGQLWIESARGTGLDPMRIGVSLGFDPDGCPVVRQTVKNELLVGDVLLRIDGNETCSAWHHQIQGWLAGDEGQRREVVIRRDGEERPLTITVSDLYGN
jgi:S1-C subfamily serine protease